MNVLAARWRMNEQISAFCMMRESTWLVFFEESFMLRQMTQKNNDIRATVERVAKKTTKSVIQFGAQLFHSKIEETSISNKLFSDNQKPFRISNTWLKFSFTSIL